MEVFAGVSKIFIDDLLLQVSCADRLEKDQVPTRRKYHTLMVSESGSNSLTYALAPVGMETARKDLRYAAESDPLWGVPRKYIVWMRRARSWYASCIWARIYAFLKEQGQPSLEHVKLE